MVSSAQGRAGRVFLADGPCRDGGGGGGESVCNLQPPSKYIYVSKCIQAVSKPSAFQPVLVSLSFSLSFSPPHPPAFSRPNLPMAPPGRQRRPSRHPSAPERGQALVPCLMPSLHVPRGGQAGHLSPRVSLSLSLSLSLSFLSLSLSLSLIATGRPAMCIRVNDDLTMRSRTYWFLLCIVHLSRWLLASHQSGSTCTGLYYAVCESTQGCWAASTCSASEGRGGRLVLRRVARFPCTRLVSLSLLSLSLLSFSLSLSLSHSLCLSLSLSQSLSLSLALCLCVCLSLCLPRSATSCSHSLGGKG